MTMDERSGVRYGQVHTSGYPGLAGLHQQGCNQAQAGGLVGRDTHPCCWAMVFPLSKGFLILVLQTAPRITPGPLSLQ